VLGDTVDHAPAAEIAIRQGWTGIGIPEDRGGQGGGTLELAILAEELGRGAVPADRLYSALLAAALLVHVEDPQASALVRAIAGGEGSAALLRHAGKPLDAPAGGCANRMVLGAHGADVLIAYDADGLWLADAEVTQTHPLLMVDRTRALAEVVGAAESARRLGTVAAEHLTHVAATAAVIIGADTLGAAQRMLDLTIEYVGQRTQFGVPVGSFQAVKHAASEMLVAIEGSRAVVQYAAWAVAVQEPHHAIDAWVAKARSARAGKLVADRALFLHGAVGYTWEHDLQLLFKRAKSDAQLFGGPSRYEERIADALELVPG
jgi:alkylation response protein AidB-like acyl-CoA dehydrogenase